MKDTQYGQYRRIILHSVGIALSVCVLILSARAQITTGSILRTVKDNSGAAVKGADDFAAPAPNTYGNSSRGALYAPGNFNVDGSLAKSFALTEKLRFQFRFDNRFNTPYFGFPNANIGSPTAGQIRSTLADNRSLQGAL